MASWFSSPKAPPPRDLMTEEQRTALGQLGAAPIQLAAEQAYQPGYVSLQNQNMYRSLFGNPAGQRTVDYSYEQPYQEQVGSSEGSSTLPSWMRAVDPGLGIGGSALGLFKKRSTPIYADRTRTVNGSISLDENGAPGLLDLAGLTNPRLAALQSQAESLQSGYDIQRLRQYGPDLANAIDELNPDAAGLSKLATASAAKELALGKEVDPYQARQVLQQVRGDQSRRGFGQGSDNDQVYQAMALLGRGDQLYNQRLGNAERRTTNEALYGTNPYLAMFGRPSNVAGANQQYLQQSGAFAQSAGPRQFNPESGYASDLYNTNYNATAAANIAAANQRTAITGAAIGAIGGIGGSFV